MSTKTSIKRVALIAVSALGFGLMSVVPAIAGNGGITSVTVADASTTAFVGDDVSIPVKVTTTGTPTTNGDDGFTFTPSNPSNTGVTGATAPALTGSIANGGTAATSTQYLLEVVAATGYTIAASGNVLTLVTTTNAANLSGTTVGNLQFKPQTPGTYTFRVTPSKTSGKTWATEPTLQFGTFTVKVLSLGGKIGDGGAVATPFNKVNGVAGEYNYVTLQANGMARTSGALGTQVVVTGGSIISASQGTLSNDKSKLVIPGVNHATSAATASTITVGTPTAGTITVNTYVETAAGIYSTTATDTVTITVNAVAQTGTLSVANSTSILDASSPTTWSSGLTADETALVSKNASSVADNPTEEVAMIKVTLLDTLKNTMPNTTTVSATISGPGSLNIGTSEPSAALGRAVSATSSSGVVYVAVYRDGTAGKSTVTISVGTTVVATETVTFYGDVASYVATVAKKHVASSGSATSDVVEVEAYDADQNLVPSATIYASVGTATEATVEASDTTDADGLAKFNVTGVSGKFGAVTITFGNKASSPTVTTTAVVGVSSVRASTITVTTDKATYTPGEKITLTFTAKDANGLGLPDDSYAAGTLLANSASNPSATASFTSTPFKGDSAVVLSAGVATATAYAPLASGPISWTWTVAGTAGGAATTNLAAALLGTKITASATVGASAAETAADAATEAAVEATDAANQAYEAAVVATETAEAAVAAAEDAKAAAEAATAAVEALATQVSTMMADLKAQVTKLAKTVAKILKRV